MDAHKKLTALEMKLIVLLPASASPSILSMDSTTNTLMPTLATILGCSSQVTSLTLPPPSAIFSGMSPPYFHFSSALT